MLLELWHGLPLMLPTIHLLYPSTHQLLSLHHPWIQAHNVRTKRISCTTFFFIPGFLIFFVSLSERNESLTTSFLICEIPSSSLLVKSVVVIRGLKYGFFRSLTFCLAPSYTNLLKSSLCVIYLYLLFPHISLFDSFSDKFDKDANWWIHCLTSNYLSRWYTYTIHSVIDHQRSIERDLFIKQVEIEQHAVLLAQSHGR